MAQLAEMSNKQKAAVLLITLGPNLSSQVLKHMGEEEIEKLTLEIANQRKLTQDQKDDNRVISSIRVKVEHFFARIKSYFILAHTYRGRLYGKFKTVRENRKNTVMLVVCGLCNLKSLIK